MTTTVKRDERSRNGASAGRHAAPRVAGRGIGYLAPLVIIALLMPLRRYWAVELLLVPLVLVVPGVILLRALRVPAQIVTSFPVYVPCASIAVLFLVGLTTDLAGPLIGVQVPLRAVPLLVVFEVICLALLAVSVNVSPDAAITWHPPSRPALLACPLAIPLVSAVGALRLNNGHGDAVAIIGLCGALTILIIGIVLAPRIETALLIVILYAAGLAVMWAFSLRGGLVYGFDISTEYRDLHQAVLAGVWHTAHPGDAYGAMVSVTVFPALLHFITGIPDLLIFKAVYPAIGALFPVAVFGLARMILPKRWAAAAAAFIVVQATFAQEVPALARQEIALVFFAALIAAMLDSRVQRRCQWALVTVLSMAMVLSHYSTTYLATLLIGVPVLLQWIISWFRKIPRVSGGIVVAFLATLLGAALWYGPVTESGSGLTSFAKAVQAQGLDVLPNRAPGSTSLVGGLLATYLEGSAQTAMPAQQYAKLAFTYYEFNRPSVAPLPAANASRYALRGMPALTTPIKWHAGYSAFNLASLILTQLAYLLGGIGALAMALQRRASVATRQVGLIGVATLAFLILIKVSSTLAAAYNQERALLQALAIVAITLFWFTERAAGLRPRRQMAVLTGTSAALALLFVNSSGLVGAALGGGTPVNLSNSGEDFQRFYMTAPELASASWLGRMARPGELIYADRYAQLRLLAATEIPSRSMVVDVTPRTISQHAWVYASQSNIVDRRGRALWNNHVVSYVYPSAFLVDNYNVVFTDGASEVFHR